MAAILLLFALIVAGQFEAVEACTQNAELCFALDGSTSVCGGDQTCENWELALNFSKNIVKSFNIGLLASKVAFATFFDKCEVQFDLRQYTSLNPLLAAISGVPFQGGNFTDLASTQIFFTQIFNPLYGDSILLKDLLLLITDGVPSISEAEAHAASTIIQNSRITTFVICIQTGCPESWAKAVASTPEKPGLKTYFLVDNYSSLEGIREAVLKEICYFLGDDLPSQPIVELNITLTGSK